jgi:hypothetical protein
MEGFIWAAGIIAVIIGLLANYGAAVDTLYKILGLNRVQPKLAISLISNGKGRSVRSNAYIPSSIKLGEAVPFDRQQELIYDYYFFWDYEIVITNQSEFPAIDTRLAQVVGTLTELHFTDKSIIRTIPFAFNAPKTFKIRFTRMYRCNLIQAEELSSNKPFSKLILQYTNLDGKKYYTEFTNTDAKPLNKFGKEKVNIISL